MRLPITIDQYTPSLTLPRDRGRVSEGVFGENDPPFGNGFSKQSSVARICRSLAQIGDVVAGNPHRQHGLRPNVGIDEKAHATWRRSSDLLQR